ncbi:MAG: patatin-like phospholipase family protein [Bacteroidales bacterium]|jgi:patatin-like phospholipase/acyl hydrolase|nr:patatin-like phospholipase family protein [Bacteroidales bacterium]
MYRILSIDGGGIRGLIPAVILAYMEEQLQARTGDPNATIADFFDMIAGTSTGGILTCFYLMPPEKEQSLHSRYPARDAVDIYAKRGREIFKRRFGRFGLTSEIYSSTGIERVLKEYMGSVTLAETRKDCLITAYDITERKAVFFTRPDARRYPHRNYLLRDVARATSAAPTYFEPAEIRSQGGVTAYLVDGAMFAGNPTLCAWVEAKKRNLALATAEKEESAAPPEMTGENRPFILSIGTGKERKKYDYNKAKDWGLIGWARPVVDVLLSSSAEVVDYQMRKLYLLPSSKERESHSAPLTDFPEKKNGGDVGETKPPENNNGGYLRLEPALGKAKPDMDDASPDNIRRLIDAAHAFIEENLEQLDETIKIVNNE